MIRISLIIAISMFLAGCVSIERRHSYAAEKTGDWKDLGCRIFQFKCNAGDITLAPIVTYSSNAREQDPPWLYVRFRSPKRIENCDLFYLTLENQSTREVTRPVSAKIVNMGKEPNSDNQVTDCYYYFDIEERKSPATLNISEQVLGCPIDPLTYEYQEYMEWQPVQLM